MTKFLAFMVIWIIGCAFVDFVVPEISNAWKMSIGYGVGLIGSIVAEKL